MSVAAPADDRPSRARGPALLIVVVTYNSARVLPALLDSLPAALGPSSRGRLVVADNASSDGTIDVVRRLAPTAQILHVGRNAGYAAAFNTAVACSPRHDRVLLLNADLELRPGSIAALCGCMDETGAGVVVPRIEGPDGALVPSLRREPRVSRALGEAVLGGYRAGTAALGELIVDPTVYEHRSSADWASGAAMLLSMSCLEQVGPWDESFFLYSEETDFCLRARDAGHRLVLEPDARVVHLGGDAPRSPALWALEQTNRVRLFARRNGRLRTHAFRAALLTGEAARAAVRRHSVHRASSRALSRMAVGPIEDLARTPRRPHVLIAVENLPVPLDRRVWLEAQALVAEGVRVSVVCPKGPGEPGFEVRRGVRLHRYAPAPPTHGVLSFLFEFVYCWVRTVWLTARIAARERVDVFQACNPPDTFFAVARLLKPFGTRFVYDQHDLCPELFETRFAGRRRFLLHGVLLLEGLTYRAADRVISPNESYRRVAIERGRVDPDRVTVVRNGPDPSRLYAVAPRPELQLGRRYLAVYLGIMGPQDGVDTILRVAHSTREELGRDDVSFALLGFGDELERLRELAADLGVDDLVTFTGKADDHMIRDYLSTADVGLAPDPPTTFNDRSTMNKTMEYMAFGLPVVSFDLTEGRASAGDAAVYVDTPDAHAFAKVMLELLDDPRRRRLMGTTGRARVENLLAWPHQRPRYLDAIRSVMG